MKSLIIISLLTASLLIGHCQGGKKKVEKKRAPVVRPAAHVKAVHAPVPLKRAAASHPTTPKPPPPPKMFKNPILDTHVSEPSMIKLGDYYYIVQAKNNSIEVLKSPSLSNFHKPEKHEVLKLKNAKAVINSPKIYYVRGELYIYFSVADDGSEGNQRLEVIKSLDPNSPTGKWGNETRLLLEKEFVDRDGTVLAYPNGDLYFIWSGKPQSDNQWNLYMARMEDPMKIVGPRALLREPKMDWEKHGVATNRAPFVLKHHGRILLAFSASSIDGPDSCLGIMGIDGGRDPMLASNWWDDVQRCVFGRNDTEQVYGPAHASFVMSPDNSETWMAYSACADVVDCVSRIVRIRKIEWETNSPQFPSALGPKRELEAPHGDKK